MAKQRISDKVAEQRAKTPPKTTSDAKPANAPGHVHTFYDLLTEGQTMLPHVDYLTKTLKNESPEWLSDANFFVTNQSAPIKDMPSEVSKRAHSIAERVSKRYSERQARFGKT